MPQSNPRVVILGAGFGGLEATKTLRRAPVEIILIDRQNYHCFQPLLYQIATGDRIEAGSVIWAAGIMASPAAQWVSTEHDRGGRVVVCPDLSLPGFNNIFVIGDSVREGRDRSTSSRSGIGCQTDG
jgi:NADH dehydrogenase FAD-containing subunit